MSKLIKDIENQTVIKKQRGGARPGSGRPANWFRKLCEQQFICKKGQAVIELGKIARGEAKLEKVFQHEGEIIRADTGVTPSDMVSAATFLADRAFGRPTQTTDITSGGRDLLDILTEARSES